MAAAIALSGCGGGGGIRPSMPGGGTMEPVVDGEHMDVALPLPFGHGVSAGEITLRPGESEEHGNVVLACPTVGSACVVTVAADGTASYERAGGMPTFVLLSPEELPELRAWRPVHAAQAPIVDRQGILHVGADVAPSAGQLTAGQTRNGVATSSGRVKDGTEAGRVIEFLEVHVGARTSSAGEGYTFTRTTTGLPTFPDRPTVRLAAGTSDELAEHAVRAVQLINAALPYEKRVAFGTDPAPALARDRRHPRRRDLHRIGAASAEDWNLANPDYRPGAAAVAESGTTTEWDAVQQRWEAREMRAAHVWFDLERIRNAAWVRNPDTREYEEILLQGPVTDPDRRVYSEEDIFSIMVHELMHALGFLAHNDGTRFEDSIMRDSQLLEIQALPAIDGDALLAAHDRFEPGTEPEELSVQSLGAWTDTSFHLRGRLAFPGGAASFGVASRNGRRPALGHGSHAMDPGPRGTIGHCREP